MKPDLKEAARGIMRAALDAADPRAAVLAALALRPGPAGGTLVSRGLERPFGGRLVVAAVGKAAPAMTAGALEALAPLAGRIASGIVVVPHGYPRQLGPAGAGFEIHESGHPVPDASGVKAAQRLAEVIASMRKEDLALVLLSGGGSSLLPLPAPPVSLADKAAVTSLLLASGADITEINTVRKHLSAIKGGQLAERCRGSIETLAVSDVVGDQLPFIASGPTVPDPTTFADALAALGRYRLLERVPPAARARIEDGAAGKLPETPKRLPARHRAGVIASNSIAVDAAAAEARRLGFAPRVLSTSLTGEAREAGARIAAAVREAKAGRPAAPPACLLWGGETTVTLRGSGKGGRNQEIALAAALDLAGLDGVLVASFATDGKEGNTDAAGAFASGATIATAAARGRRDPRAALEANDSNSFLAAAGELIVTGPTGTNVNDISIALIA